MVGISARVRESNLVRTLPSPTPREYRALVESSPVLIWRAGLDGECDYFNGTWLSFTGKTVSDEAGTGWVAGVHPDDVERCLAVSRDSFASRVAFEREYRLRRHDGVYRYMYDSAVPYDGDDGKFAGFVGSCIDIQERRDLDVSKTSFLTLMAHEMRTPLSVLATYVEVVRRKVELGQAPPTLTLEKMLRQVRVFARLITDLSSVARLEEGRPIEVNPAPMDLAAMFTETVQGFAELLETGEYATHTVAMEVAPGPQPILGDENRLAQAIRSFLDNAKKYSPNGGEIVAKLETRDGGYALSVTDRGIGIPADELAKITRRYFRGSNADPKNFSGVGLGLAFAYEIAAAHGGRLETVSTLGKGTTITLVLPASVRP